MTGQIVDPLGGLEIGPADGLGEFEISGAGAGEGGHVASAAEDLAEVVTVGADIETFGAVDAEANGGQSDLKNLVFVDTDLAGGAVDGFALPSQFVEGNPVLFDGGNHRRNLVEFTGEFREGSVDRRAIQRGDRSAFEDFSGGILGIGGFAEFQGALVLLVFRHEEVLDPGGFADDEHQEAGGDGVEGAAVADLTLIKATANEVDNVVGSSAGRFVDQE